MLVPFRKLCRLAVAHQHELSVLGHLSYPGNRELAAQAPSRCHTSAHAAWRREQELVVLTARHRGNDRVNTACFIPLSGSGRDRDERGVDSGAQPAGLGQLTDPVNEPVAQIDARSRRPVSPELCSESDPGLRTEVSVSALLNGIGGWLIRRRIFQPRQTGGGATDLAADIQVVARTRSGPGQDSPPFYAAHRSHVKIHGAARPGEIAPNERGPVPGRERQQTIEQCVELTDEQRAREGERKERVSWDGTHRREVTQIDRQRLVADRVHGGERPVEVHAFDHGVGRDDRERTAVGFDDGRIVADTHENGLRRVRHPGVNSGDERVLAEVGDGLVGQPTGPDLSRIINCPGLADDSDLDLTRVLELVLDPLRDAFGEPDGFFIGDLLASLP